ncbi:MAG: uroporphyrinogen decarboxylase family protein [Euryarchaeota archaeon]|nr:uroporphyrinogen decarboxylase family protein [Euryarchaeota archaeon]
MNHEMTPMERTLTALRHDEPDRVPTFLNLTMHGAKIQGIPIKKYFSDPDAIVKGQLALGKKFGNDCYNAFTYSAAEAETFGAETIFYEDGPPNAGRPVIGSFSDIDSLEVPEIDNTRSMMVTIEATKKLKKEVGEDVPIIGVVISPFSLPIMQMGFENYLELMYSDPARLRALMKVNREFEVDYANRQIEAGATVIMYLDPVSSPTILPREKFVETGFGVAQKSISSIKAPVIIHFASGRFLPIVDKVIEMGVIGVGVSNEEDLGAVKTACGDKLALVGNLNGLQMPTWTEKDVEAQVKDAISKAAAGGGYVLSDNHGEIPYQVPEDVLGWITASCRKYGKY